MIEGRGILLNMMQWIGDCLQPWEAFSEWQGHRRKETSFTVSPLEQSYPLPEVYGKGSGKNGLMTKAHEALKSPVVEASPSVLPTSWLGALNKNMNRASFEDTVDFLEKGWKSKPPKLSQMTGDKHILKAL